LRARCLQEDDYAAHEPRTEASAYAAQWLQSFREFPPRVEPASFTIEQANEAMLSAGQG
jgi:hypothetical protein